MAGGFYCVRLRLGDNTLRWRIVAADHALHAPICLMDEYRPEDIAQITINPISNEHISPKETA